MNLIACPCCGYATLKERNEYEICGICWWEDDGQDNSDADEVLEGPNYQWSLTQARANFITTGISCPDREDLRKNQQDPKGYKKIRFFTLSSDGKVTEET